MRMQGSNAKERAKGKADQANDEGTRSRNEETRDQKAKGNHDEEMGSRMETRAIEEPRRKPGVGKQVVRRMK